MFTAKARCFVDYTGYSKFPYFLDKSTVRVETWVQPSCDNSHGRTIVNGGDHIVQILSKLLQINFQPGFSSTVIQG